MSTAADMAKWIKFNLNSGKTETGVQLLDKKRMDEIHTITTAMMPSVSLTKPDFPISDIVGGYGYGWIVSEYRGIFVKFRNVGINIEWLIFYKWCLLGMYSGERIYH